MQSEESLRKHTWIGTALCVLVFLACIALVHPVLEAGYSDDFSYIFTAKRAAETGRLIYNGWACPMLGYQVYLGALFIRLFGFSFTATRAAVMLLSTLNLIVLHRLFLRLSKARLNAAIAALSLSLGPITLGYSLVFFTDVPGQLAFAVALYCCVRAMQSQEASGTRRWLLWAVLLNLALGTVRQTAWLGALVLVPTVAWHLRHRSGVLALAVKLWFLSLLVVGAGVFWLSHAPYAPQESLHQHLSKGWLRMLPLLPIFLFAEMLPLLSSAVAIRSVFRQRSFYLRAATASVIAILWLWFVRSTFPVVLLRDVLGYDLSFGVWIALALLLAIVVLLAVVWNAVSMALHRPQKGGREGASFRDLLIVTAPYVVICCSLVMTRESTWARYILPLTPVAAVLVFRLHAECTGERRFPVPSILLAVAWMALGVTILHDRLLAHRPVLALQGWAVEHGIPRSQMEVSMEDDGWYELSTGHHVNEPRIRVPRDAWTPRPMTLQQRVCHSYFLPFAPDIHPLYAVTATPSPCFQPEPVRQATQSFWMRPMLTESLMRYIPSQRMP